LFCGPAYPIRGPGLGLGLGLGVGVGVGSPGVGLGAGVGLGLGLPLGVGLAPGLGLGTGSGLGVGLASGLGDGVWAGIAAGFATSVPVAAGVPLLVVVFATFFDGIKLHFIVAPDTGVSVSLLPLFLPRNEMTFDVAAALGSAALI
jgi:hypothetical protein